MECWEIGRILGLEETSAEDALVARWSAHLEGRAVTSWDEVNT